MPVVLAIACCVILGGLAVLHIALIAGAPLGRFAWGGQQDVLVGHQRLNSAVAVAVFIVAGALELQAANLIAVMPALVGDVLIYVVCAGAFASFIASAVSRSHYQRNAMIPTFLVLAAATLIVAVTGHLAH